MALTGADLQLVKDVGFDQDICELIKTHCDTSLLRLKAFNDEGELAEVAGIAISASREEVLEIIGKLQALLIPCGYRAFWSELYGPNGSQQSDVVAILKSVDDSEIVRLQGSNGGNYDVSNEKVLEKIQNWRDLCELEIVGASGAWVAIQFKTLPKDLGAIAEDIYEFCPDSVEQGVGLQNEKDDPEKFAAARQLMPKLSAKMEKILNDRDASYAAMEIPPELRAAMAASSFTTKTDMGIRLLAYELQESKQLFLWWD